jgi:hypothetical protein
MRRVYYPYVVWEDYRAGMFRLSDRIVEHEALAYELLTSPDDFRHVISELFRVWPLSTEHNLTATETNRRAWVGAAACCLQHGCTEHTVRTAWHRMTEIEQGRANRVADSMIAEWEAEASGAQTLFA